MPEVAIDLIDRGFRIRPLNEAQVGTLMASIAESGLLNPITVRPRPIVVGGRARDGYTLIAGLHRLEAMNRLGRETIMVSLSDLSGSDAIIAECDENLCGPNLTAAERALFTRRRKEAYEALHPETRHGENQHSRSGQLGHSTSVRFTADTAEKTGQSERAVRRDARRGTAIPAPMLEAITGTPLDRGAVLDRLAGSDQPEAELATIAQEKEAAAPPAPPAPRATRPCVSARYADWLIARMDPAELPQLITWIEKVRPHDLVRALRASPGWSRPDAGRDAP